MKLNPSTFKTQPAFWAGLLLLLIAAVALRAKLLDSFPLSSDEGIHLIWLRLLAAGYQPYSEVYITYPPLYPLSIAAVWQVWPAETVQRWFSVVYTLFGAVGVALLARKFSGAVAGIAAAALTLFSPPLVEASRAILGEFPAVAWSIWAIWLAWLAGDEGVTQQASQPAHEARSRNSAALFTKRRIFLILSGLCLAASLLTKLLMPFVGLLIPLILIMKQRDNKGVKDQVSGVKGQVLPNPPHAPRFTFHASFLIDLLLWSAGVILPIIIFLSVFEVGPLVRQVVGQRLEARTAYTETEPFWPPRYERGAMFVQEDAALVVLALAGIGLVWLRRQPDRELMWVWLILAVAMLAVHNPIRYKHFLILIPPLAIFGGTAVGFWILDFGFWISQRGPWPLRATSLALDRKRKGQAYNPGFISYQTPLIASAGLMLLAGLYIWQIPATLALWQAKAAEEQPPADEVEALAFIETMTAPGDCLISDDMQLLYWSGRMAPPELAEVSENRLNSGALITAELIEITDAYDCQLVAAVSNRIAKYLPDYMAWVKQNYLGLFHYGEDDLFFAKINTDPRPATPLQADFAGQILFHGYTLPAGPAAPGAQLPLTLIWQAQTSLTTDYAVFVQLRDAAQTTLASADHQPYQGLVPTSTWPAGAVIQEVSWLHLPETLPAGSYHIYVGLYRPDNLERLPLVHDSSGENALILGPIVVQ